MSANFSGSSGSKDLSRLGNDLLKFKLNQFQATKDLCALSQANRYFFSLYRSQCGLIAELLSCTLNIDESHQKRRKEILPDLSEVDPKNLEKVQSLLLGRTTATEYFMNTKICKKLWTDVNQLEIAARFGELQYIKYMFSIFSNKQKEQAIAQLKAVKKLRSIPSEPGSYICGVAEVRFAYQQLIEKFPDPLSYGELSNRTALGERIKLMLNVADAFKNLPCHILQLFCLLRDGHMSHEPFIILPAVRSCKLKGRNYVDLDITSIGSSTSCFIYKGNDNSANISKLTRDENIVRIIRVIYDALPEDILFFDNLEKEITTNIDKIIKTESEKLAEAARCAKASEVSQEPQVIQEPQVSQEIQSVTTPAIVTPSATPDVNKPKPSPY